MNQYEAQRLLAKRSDYQPSHVLHLLLSVITAGLWIPIWLLVAISHRIERSKIDKKLKRMEDEEVQEVGPRTPSDPRTSAGGSSEQEASRRSRLSIWREDGALDIEKVVLYIALVMYFIGAQQEPPVIAWISMGLSAVAGIMLLVRRREEGKRSGS